MVRGLEVFRDWFKGYSDQYVLIGGTAATFAMEQASLDFRATKDLDIVLHVEVLTPAFGEAFWAFVRAGQYEHCQVSSTGKPVFYRFQRPGNRDFPAMLELFSRPPEHFTPARGSVLTPIPLDEAISSLSAILLDDDYYAFILSGRRETDGLPWIGEDRLIPLKALAWLDLSARRDQGEPVDSKDVRKHLNDVLRLSQLLTARSSISLVDCIRSDMERFLVVLQAESSIDLKAIGVGGRVQVSDIIERLAHAYNLEIPAGSN